MTELAKRYRAARCYADLSQDELGQALGLDRKSVNRREAGEIGPKKAELVAVATVTGVPVTFFSLDQPAPELDPDEDHGEALTRRLAHIETRIQALAERDDNEMVKRVVELLQAKATATDTQPGDADRPAVSPDADAPSPPPPSDVQPQPPTDPAKQPKPPPQKHGRQGKGRRATGT